VIHLVRVSDLVGRQYLTADDDAGGAVAAVGGDAVVQVSKVSRDYGIEDKGRLYFTADAAIAGELLVSCCWWR